VVTIKDLKIIDGKLIAHSYLFSQLISCRAILQQYVPRFVWFLFNVTFISFYQSALLFSFSCVPAYAILCSTKFEQDVTTADIVFALIMVGLVYSEWVSDGQQWGEYFVCFDV
jgi:hypothetical protein